MTKGRRAQKRSIPSLWLWVAVAALIATAGVLIGTTLGPVRTVAGPTEYRDWPVYVATTPQGCRDAIAEMEKIYWSSVAFDDASMKAVEKLRTAKTLSDVRAAKKENDKARRAAKVLTDSRRAYLDQSKKCQGAK